VEKHLVSNGKIVYDVLMTKDAADKEIAVLSAAFLFLQ
jgi:hypothetical protein